jgi:predicted RNA-binding protein YlxR (DUF448 family)
MSQKPIRTCIKCRSKLSQNILQRLQCIDKKLIPFTGSGRSFYICERCLQNKDTLEKVLYKQCKNKDDYISQLEEIRRNG